MTAPIPTKLTKGGQTTVPKEIRSALGMKEESRVWWRLEEGKAIISAERPVPNEVGSAQEFWDGVNLALEDAAAGRTREAGAISDELRSKYGLG